MLSEEQAELLSKVATAGMLNLDKEDKASSAILYDKDLASLKKTAVILNRGSAGVSNEILFTFFERFRAWANLPAIFGASNATRDYAQIAKKLDEYNAYAKTNKLREYTFKNIAHSLGVSGNKNMLNWSEHLNQKYNNTNVEYLHLGGSYPSIEITKQSKTLFKHTQTEYLGVDGDFVYTGIPILRNLGLGMIGNNPNAKEVKGLNIFEAHSDANQNINNFKFIYSSKYTFNNSEEKQEVKENKEKILKLIYPNSNGNRVFNRVD